jgi:hypothetical protein
MHGSGLIELLAREMTGDLHRIRSDVLAEARASGKRVRRQLVTKGVGFGYISGERDGTVSLTEVEGIDKDLVVRPWSQKGVVTSLRTFTVTALNQHHGMQAVERFGVRRTGSLDFDRDGVIDELSEGDVTALTLFQALLPVPGVRLPLSPERAAAADSGRKIFSSIGCDACHRLALPLESTVYKEPGPYNLEGTLRQSEVGHAFSVDLASLPGTDRLKHDSQRHALVEAFTDLKRHRIADGEEPFYANEVVSQGFAPTDEFLTRRLWDVGNTAPYGHRGDVSTLHEAIVRHGGEARAVRLRYLALPENERAAIIEFLRSLQIIPFANAQENPPNELSERLQSLASRWREQNQHVLFTELVTRAEAAAVRAEGSCGHTRSLLLRIKQELRKLNKDPENLPVAAALLPPKPTLLTGRLVRSATGSEQSGDLKRLIEAIARAEKALQETYPLAQRALAGASLVGGTSGIPVPVGHEDSDLLFASIKRHMSAGDFNLAAQEFVSWSEDVAFRTEQLTQQVDLAALRLEAAADIVN